VSSDGVGELLDFDPQIFGEMKLSPDGRKLGIVVQNAARLELWIYDLELGTRSLFAGSTERVRTMVWTADSQSIIYAKVVATADGDVEELRLRSLGENESTTLFSNAGTVRATSITDDGRFIAGQEDFQIVGFQFENNAIVDAIRYTPVGSQNWGPSVSPDGKYVAYTNLDEGQSNIHVQSTMPGGRVWQVSADGGEEPRWSSAGDKLYFSQGRNWFEIDVDTDEGFRYSRPRQIFSGPYLNVPGFGYDVYSDGSGFLVVKGAEQDSLVTEIKVIVNVDQMLLEKASPRE
jgi:Tol biopolymer transport system component